MPGQSVQVAEVASLRRAGSGRIPGHPCRGQIPSRHAGASPSRTPWIQIGNCAMARPFRFEAVEAHCRWCRSGLFPAVSRRECKPNTIPNTAGDTANVDMRKGLYLLCSNPLQKHWSIRRHVTRTFWSVQCTSDCWCVHCIYAH